MKRLLIFWTLLIGNRPQMLICYCVVRQQRLINLLYLNSLMPQMRKILLRMNVVNVGFYDYYTEICRFVQFQQIFDFPIGSKLSYRLYLFFQLLGGFRHDQKLLRIMKWNYLLDRLVPL